MIRKIVFVAACVWVLMRGCEWCPADNLNSNGPYSQMPGINNNAPSQYKGAFAGDGGGLTNAGPLTVDETNMDTPAWVKWRASQVDTFGNIGKNNLPHVQGKIQRGQTFSVDFVGTGLMSWLSTDLATNFLNNFPFAGASFINTPLFPFVNEINVNAMTNLLVVNNNAGTNWFTGISALTNTASQNLAAFSGFANYPWNQIRSFWIASPEGCTLTLYTNATAANPAAWNAASTFSTLTTGGAVYCTNWTVNLLAGFPYNTGGFGVYEYMIVMTTPGTNYILNLECKNTTITNGVVLNWDYIGSSGHFDEFTNVTLSVYTNYFVQLGADLMCFQNVDLSTEWLANGPLTFGPLRAACPNMDISLANNTPSTTDHDGTSDDDFVVNPIVSSNAISMNMSMFDMYSFIESTNNVLLRNWLDVGRGWPHIDNAYQGWDGFSAGAYGWYRWMGLQNFYYSGATPNYVQYAIALSDIYNGGWGGGLVQLMGGTGWGGPYFSQVGPNNGVAIVDCPYQAFQIAGLTNIVVSGNVVVTNLTPDSLSVYFSFTTNSASGPGHYGYVQDSITLPVPSTATNAVPFSALWTPSQITLSNLTTLEIILQNNTTGGTNIFFPGGITVTNRP